MTLDTKDWYTSWFNTSYYHLLYKDRNDEEAHAFMEHLVNHLHLNKDAHILDLACGRGRHSRYLNSIGYEVTGLDLSLENIAFAKQFENETLHFDVHNMSNPYHKQFDAVFNLFTSFGYFKDEADNYKAIEAIKFNLNPNGLGVIDFLNTTYVEKHLKAKEIKIIDGIVFSIKRQIKQNYIIKDIQYEAEGKTHHYQERVKAFTIHDFKKMFLKAKLNLIDVFGNYALNTFNKDTSQRLILVFNRNE